MQRRRAFWVGLLVVAAVAVGVVGVAGTAVLFKLFARDTQGAASNTPLVPAVPSESTAVRSVGTLYGEVLSGVHEAGIAAAHVTATLADGSLLTTRTDDVGAFRFERPRAPIIALRFAAAGYDSATVEKGALPPSSSDAHWQQILTPLPRDASFAHVSGTVVDEAGAPVTAFRLGVVGKGAPPPEEVTSPQGLFERDLPPGDLALFVVASGYRPSALQSVQARAGEAVVVRLVLQRSPRVVGSVHDDKTQAPIAGATVALAGRRAPAPVRTDAAGRFIIDSVPAEHLGLMVRANGYAELQAGGVDGSRDRNTNLELSLTPLSPGAAPATEVTGIGVTIGKGKEGPVVLSVLPGSPAEGRLHEGDVIVEVDGRTLLDRPLTDTMGAIRGAPGTSVTLLVRKKEGGEQSLFIERTRMSVPDRPRPAR